MATSRDLLKALDRFELTPESRGYDLRLSLSALVTHRLKAKRWTQKQLATATGMKEPFITRIIHADSNCTFEVAGRILHALGIVAQLREVRTAPAVELHEALVVTGAVGAEYEPISINIGTRGHGQKKASSYWKATGTFEGTGATRGSFVSIDTAHGQPSLSYAVG